MGGGGEQIWERQDRLEGVYGGGISFRDKISI